jgi:hypothetical protein
MASKESFIEFPITLRACSSKLAGPGICRVFEPMNARFFQAKKLIYGQGLTGSE